MGLFLSSGCFGFATASPERWRSKGTLTRQKAVLAESLKLKPEINSLAQWYAWLPWTSKANAPRFWALQDRTLDTGLRRIGFPEN